LGDRLEALLAEVEDLFSQAKARGDSRTALQAAQAAKQLADSLGRLRSSAPVGVVGEGYIHGRTVLGHVVNAFTEAVAEIGSNDPALIFRSPRVDPTTAYDYAHRRPKEERTLLAPSPEQCEELRLIFAAKVRRLGDGGTDVLHRLSSGGDEPGD
jgi:hypothetical protein